MEKKLLTEEKDRKYEFRDYHIPKTYHFFKIKYRSKDAIKSELFFKNYAKIQQLIDITL